jgi:hypothetical protein
MRNRDENVAMRALIAAAEANNQTLRAVLARLDAIDTHVSVLIDTVAEHIANHND